MDGSRLSYWDVVPEPAERTVKGKSVANRTSRLRALGNAVVPQQVYPIFKAIMEAEKYERTSISAEHEPDVQ